MSGRKEALTPEEKLLMGLDRTVPGHLYNHQRMMRADDVREEAYSQLGDEKGRYTTFRQVKKVLSAERSVSSFLVPLPTDEEGVIIPWYSRAELKVVRMAIARTPLFSVDDGRNEIGKFFLKKATIFDRLSLEKEEENPNIAIEYKRRSIACKEAAGLCGINSKTKIQTTHRMETGFKAAPIARKA